MRLQEIFDQLSSTEFSQMSLGGQLAGVINATNYDKVIGHLNLALTALFTRFNLKTGELVLQMQENQTTYKLKSAFAVNGVGSTEPVRYIIDTAGAPFQDDVLKVTKVVGAEYGELPLNDAADDMSVTTPSSLVLRVPAMLETQDLTVSYRANHPKIATGQGDLDPAEVEIELPDTHLTALLYFVASRVNNPIGMANEFHAGNSYYAKYEQACQELEDKGMQVDQGQTNTRAQRNGWV